MNFEPRFIRCVHSIGESNKTLYFYDIWIALSYTNYSSKIAIYSKLDLNMGNANMHIQDKNNNFRNDDIT
jgi:hypothetical protein